MLRGAIRQPWLGDEIVVRHAEEKEKKNFPWLFCQYLSGSAGYPNTVLVSITQSVLIGPTKSVRGVQESRLAGTSLVFWKLHRVSSHVLSAVPAI